MPELRRTERALANPGRARADEKPDQYPKGRDCREPDCITVLCIWNPGPYCYLHAAKHAAEVEDQARIDQRRRAAHPVRAMAAVV